MEQSELLLELDNLRAKIETNERPIPFREACRYLDLAPSFVYKLTHRKEIPCYKPFGKKLYFMKSELNAFILRNKKG
jgi:excisionase family DNA binding protein